MAESALTDEDYNNNLIKMNNRINVKTNFNFMKNHNGLRFGNLHLLIGTSGSGKSAIANGLIGDILELNHHSIFVWLTEEKYDDFMYKFNRLELSDENKSKLVIESDVDDDSPVFDDYKSHIDYIFNQVVAIGSKILLIDNITTFSMYAGMPPSVQSEISMYLKRKTAQANIATVIIAHTKKDVPDNADFELNESHIRGSSVITNISEYLYVYQRFAFESSYVPIVRVIKHRAKSMLDKIYLLKFSRKKELYISDNAITFEQYKEHFLSKNSLKKRR